MKATKTMLAAVSLVGLTGCATIPPRGSIYYTTANIWYTVPGDIRSTNYHEGAMIPFGSQVTIDGLSSRGVGFTTTNNLTCRMVYVGKHSTISMREHFNLYFSVDDPSKPGSEFDRFSEMEKENVKKGNLIIGMSKAAVLAAYGYPPSHTTPDLTVDYWRYWTRFRQEVHVCFENGRVSKLEKVAVAGPPPGLKKLTSVSSLLE